MNKELFCILIMSSCFLSQYSHCQNLVNNSNGRLKGEVVASDTQEPMELVNVFLMVADTIKYGTITNREGKFDLKNIAPGNYTFSLRYIGFKTIRIPISIMEETRQLGVFKMQTNSNELDEVEVVGEDNKVLQRLLNKTTVNISNSLRSTGTLKEVLDEAPQITIDSDENIAVNGSTDVLILLNGKRLQNSLALSILENLKAENIKSVEVITNPSAKYASDGTGIINIITKRTFSKLAEITGNVGTFPQAGESVFVSFPINRKTAFRTLYDYNYSKIGAFSDTQTLDLASSVFSRQIENREHELKAHFVSFEVDTNWNSRNNLQTGFYFLNNNSGIQKQIEVFTGTESSEVDINRNSASTFDVNNYDWQVGYTHYFQDSNNWLNVDYNGTLGESSKISNIRDRSENQQINLDNDFIDKRYVNEFELRYTNAIGKWKYEGGTNFRIRNFEYTSITTSNTTNLAVEQFTGAFDYDDAITAVFVDINRKLLKNWDLFIGLRQEFTAIKLNIDDSIIKRDQNNFFPYFALSKNWDRKLNFDLSYRKKINRPKPNYLNPFFDLTDPSNLRLGNINVTSELINEINTSISFRKKKWLLSIDSFYRDRKDPVQLIAEVSNDTTFVQYRNIDKITNLGGNIYTRFSVSSKLQTSIILNFDYTQLEDKTLNNQNQGLNWSFRLRQNIKLEKIFDAQIGFNYYAPQNILQGKIEKINFMDLYISRNIFNERGSVYLQWKDIFNTNEIRIVGVTADFDRDLFRNRETNVLIVGFQYTLFNEYKNKKKMNKIKKLYESDEYQ
jgi:hypothetical protein